MKRKTVKDLIASVTIGPDFYKIRWKDKQKARGKIKGGTTTIYFDTHNDLIKILVKLGKQNPGELIPAQSVADELTILHPKLLKTKMLRPTGKYSELYYSSLHLEHFYKRIIYFYNGEIFLDEGFYKMYGDGVPEIKKQNLGDFFDD